jgi:hypothetical protein
MKTNNNRHSKSELRGSLLTLAFSLCVLAFAAVSAAGCMVSVDAEVPDVEITQKGLTFAGVPLGGALGDVSMTQTFSQDHDALALPNGLTSEIKALEVSLTAKEGVTDFGFVHYLRLTMSDDSHNANAIELINFERDASAAPSAVLQMVATNPVDTLEKWKTKSVLFTIDIAGTLPAKDWVADIAVRFGGKVHYQR